VRVAAAVDGEPVLLAQDRWIAASFHPELGHEDKVHRWFLDRVRSGLQSR
jgi:5'-phosphate synthase pdxT subunit